MQKWRRFGFLNEADQLRLQIALQNMRMSCNSTYLLDQTTDFGNKSDEAITLLDEMFEKPEYYKNEKVRGEVMTTRRLYEYHGWPSIDVTRRSIEETAAAIMNLLSEHKLAKEEQT